MTNSFQDKISQFYILIILISIFIISTAIGQVHNPESFLKRLMETADENFLINNLSTNNHPARFFSDSTYHVISEFTYHDIYREWLNEKLKLSANQYDGKFSVILPLKYYNNPGNISLDLNYRNLSFEDHENDDDADVSITNWSQYSLAGSIGWQLNQHRIGLFWLMEYASDQTNVLIKKYYHDPEDDLLNRYFYNLLEPTFGEKIKFEQIHKRYKINGEYIFSYQKYFNSGFTLSRQFLNNNYKISYVNNNDRLAGQKNLDGPVDGDLYSIHWMNEIFFKQLIVRTDIGYEEFDILFNLQALNPTKSGDIYIDIRELADSSVSMNKFGGGLGIGWKFSNTMDLAFSIATGKNTIRAKGEFKTPVLGFELLPIAHQFEGKFKFDLTEWSYQLNWQHQLLNRFGYKINTGYLNGLGILTYDNLAKMEFGIGTSRLKDEIKYDINVYQAAWESSIKIWENYLLRINILQIIPDINKRKEKEAPIPGEPTGKKKKKSYWGGTVYSIALEYQF